MWWAEAYNTLGFVEWRPFSTSVIAEFIIVDIRELVMVFRATLSSLQDGGFGNAEPVPADGGLLSPHHLACELFLQFSSDTYTEFQRHTGSRRIRGFYQHVRLARTAYHTG